MRQVPFHIQRQLSDYDPRISLVWEYDESFVKDRKMEDDANASDAGGWYFTYEGERQAFAIRHEDGTFVYDLNGDELIKILNQCDMHKHYGDLKRRFQRHMSLRERECKRRAQADRIKEETLPMVNDVTAHFSRGSAKPFIEINENPVSKEKEVTDVR